MNVSSKSNKRPIHPHNLSQVLSILEVFKCESLDASASGILRIAYSDRPMFLAEAICLALPRDYDPPVSNFQRERVAEALIKKGWC